MRKGYSKYYVVGHKNPDTDSVASAIGYADLLRLKKRKAEPLVSGQINKGTELALSEFGIKCPKHSHVADFTDAGVILVDHNEEGQWPAGVKKEQIYRVIDHHRVGRDFSTDKPIYVRVEPVGATSTIITKMYREVEKKPDKHLAGLLLSAILTDTLMLKSPSTTDDDKEAVKWLNKMVGLNMKGHFQKIFAAKSDIAGRSTLDLIKKDYKEYHFNHHTRMGISMYETIAPDQLIEKKNEILEGIKKYKKTQKLTHMIFVIVDITKMKSFVISAGNKEEETIKKIFRAKEKDGALMLSKMVSRKVQLVPEFEKYFEG